MNTHVRIQYQTVDGIKMYGRQPMEVLRAREINRVVMKIIRVDGKDRPFDQLAVTEIRKYILWSRLKNGTYVFREGI